MIQKSTSLKYEPSSELLLITARLWASDWPPLHGYRGTLLTRNRPPPRTTTSLLTTYWSESCSSLITYWSESTWSLGWFGGPASRHGSLNSLFLGEGGHGVKTLNPTQAERGTTRAEDAPGTPTQNHISPSILVNEDKTDNTTLLRRRRCTSCIFKSFRSRRSFISSPLWKF